MTTTSLRTGDILLQMVATFLTPMFLATTGDLDQARLAALGTVKACTARSPMDLILIGQMIAFGLATMSSVSLSMAEDIPINLVLRLRGNAVSLHRAAEKCRRTLPQTTANPDDAPLPDAETQAETEMTRLAEHQASSARPQLTPNTRPGHPPAAPQAAVVAEPEYPAGGPAAAVPGIAPRHHENVMRAAWLEVFPDTPQEVLDDLIRQAISETQAAPPIISATPPPA